MKEGEVVIDKSCYEMLPCQHKSTGPIKGNGVDYWNTLKQYRTLQKEQPDLWKHFRESAKNAGADVSLPSVRRVGDIQQCTLPKRDHSPGAKKKTSSHKQKKEKNKKNTKRPPTSKSRGKKRRD